MKITDETYELQGLLQLWETRRDLPADFPNLIVAKAESILSLARQLTMEQTEAPTLQARQEVSTLRVEDEAPEPMRAEEEKEETPQAKRAEKQDPTIRLAINDRIRFARELFAGDTNLLDSTMTFIAGLPAWPDVEDYFYSDLNWDPARKEVIEFMDILNFHFKRKKQ